MTIVKQFENLCQRHTEFPFVLATETSGIAHRVGPKRRLVLPGDLRRPEQHLGSDGLEAVATAQAISDLRHAVQCLRDGIGDRRIEVVEDLRSPIIDGSNQVREGVGGKWIKASLPCVVKLQGFRLATNGRLMSQIRTSSMTKLIYGHC